MSDVFGFDFNAISEETNARGPLPAGEYTVAVEKAEMKKTKSGTGFYVNLMMKVCDMDKYNKATVFDIVNIKNDNPTAEEIGRGRLKRLLTIAGVPEDKMKTTGPEALVGKKYNVYLSIDRNKEYGDRNKVSSYSEVKGMKVDASPESNGANAKPSWV